MIARFLKWSRHNLFGKPFDILLSLTVIPGFLWLAYQVAAWTVTTARWEIIPESLRILMIGIFPAEQAWRAWVAIMIIAALLGAALGCVFAFRKRHAAGLLLVLAAVIALTGSKDLTNALLTASTIAIFASGCAAISLIPLLRRALLPAGFIALIAIFAVMSPPGAAFGVACS